MYVFLTYLLVHKWLQSYCALQLTLVSLNCTATNLLHTLIQTVILNVFFFYLGGWGGSESSIVG